MVLYCPLYILPWFQATYQGSLRFCPRAKLTIEQLYRQQSCDPATLLVVPCSHACTQLHPAMPVCHDQCHLGANKLSSFFFLSISSHSQGAEGVHFLAYLAVWSVSMLATWIINGYTCEKNAYNPSALAAELLMTRGRQLPWQCSPFVPVSHPWWSLCGSQWL